MDILIKDLSKKFSIKTALENVSVEFSGGKIHALVGENGAGKSTLAKIICGELIPTGGNIFIEEESVHFTKPADALKKGIAIVNQRPQLSDSLTAEENIILSTRKKNSFFIPLKTPRELVELKKIWAPNLSLKNFVKDLGGNNRFYVSLLTALLRKPRFLILDEPSAFLDLDERRSLYSSLNELVKTGTGVIVITHSFAEATNYCHTVTVLKDGKVDAIYKNPKEYKSEIISGNDEKKMDSGSEAVLEKKPCLELKNISSTPKDKPFLLEANIVANYGEITAVAGIKEAALGTLEDFVTGINTSTSKGDVVFHDENGSEKLSLPRKKFAPAFLRKHGCAIVPSDKTFRGSNPNLTVQEMLGVYRKSKEQIKNAKKLIELAKVNIQPEEKCSSLSGGMLQRLVLERELSTDPKMVILCNPMHGLDIKSQSNLAKTITSLAKKGKAVLIVGAADFPMTLCSKVYSIENGKTKLTFEK